MNKNGPQEGFFEFCFFSLVPLYRAAVGQGVEGLPQAELSCMLKCT